MSMFENLGGLFETKKPEAAEKGVPFHAKKVDGQLYLPAVEVLELLKSNNVLPKQQAALERHLGR